MAQIAIVAAKAGMKFKEYLMNHKLLVAADITTIFGFIITGITLLTKGGKDKKSDDKEIRGNGEAMYNIGIFFLVMGIFMMPMSGIVLFSFSLAGDGLSSLISRHKLIFYGMLISIVISIFLGLVLLGVGSKKKVSDDEKEKEQGKQIYKAGVAFTVIGCLALPVLLGSTGYMASKDRNVKMQLVGGLSPF